MKTYAPFLLVFVVLSATGRGFSQTRGSDCLGISVACPNSIDPSPVNFAARVTGDDPSNKLTFNWTVSAGKIISGQGTSSISVDTADIEGKTITATVEVGGIPDGCGNKASCSTPIADPAPPTARKFDEYGDLSWAEERARLDKFAEHLEPGIRLRSHRKKLAREGSHPRNRIVR